MRLNRVLFFVAFTMAVVAGVAGVVLKDNWSFWGAFVVTFAMKAIDVAEARLLKLRDVNSRLRVAHWLCKNFAIPESRGERLAGLSIASPTVRIFRGLFSLFVCLMFLAGALA
mgnify:CR=1 FL=1